MEDGCLIGGHLMRFSCVQSGMISYMMSTITKKFLCDLKDHRQHGLTYFDKSLTLEIKNQMHF